MRQLAILTINTAVTVGLLTVLLLVDCWLFVSIALRTQ